MLKHREFAPNVFIRSKLVMHMPKNNNLVSFIPHQNDDFNPFANVAFWIRSTITIDTIQDRFSQNYYHES